MISPWPSAIVLEIPSNNNGWSVLADTIGLLGGGGFSGLLLLKSGFSFMTKIVLHSVLCMSRLKKETHTAYKHTHTHTHDWQY